MRVRAVVSALIAVVVAGCASDDVSPATPDGKPSGTLTVLAAASLAEPFDALEVALEGEYPDLDLAISLGPSSGLVEQVLAGAPADVLATADATTMGDAVDHGAVAGDPVIFAQNTLIIAVPSGNPGGVTAISDLSRDELRIALCEPQVPCGTATTQLLDGAGVDAAPDTLENNVTNVAGKVALGEVDAALVYRTDAAAKPDAIDIVDVPEADQVVNDYPIAVLSDAPNRPGADAFVAAVTGQLGRDLLAEAGFVTP